MIISTLTNIKYQKIQMFNSDIRKFRYQEIKDHRHLVSIMLILEKKMQILVSLIKTSLIFIAKIIVLLFV